MENMRLTKGSQFQVPETGKFLADDWAKIIDYEPKTLRKHIAEEKMRVIRFKGKIFIEAAWFWEDVQLMENSNDT